MEIIYFRNQVSISVSLNKNRNKNLLPICGDILPVFISNVRDKKIKKLSSLDQNALPNRLLEHFWEEFFGCKCDFREAERRMLAFTA